MGIAPRRFVKGRRLAWSPPVVQLPAPVTAAPPAPRAGVVESLERLAKAAAVLLGVLYVLGLLISNAQLLRVGISDFSLLQAKSIATGLLFVLYLGCLALLLVPPTLAFALDRHWPDARRTHPVRAMVYFVGLTLLFEAMLAALVSTMYGALLPWGLSFESPPMSWSPLQNLRHAIARLPPLWRGIDELLLHQWVVFGIVVLWLPVYVGVDAALVWARQHWDDDAAAPAEPTQGPHTGRLLAIYVAAMLLFASPYLVVGYSRDVYPNLVQSMGGGQPDVVQIQPVGERLTTFGGVDTCCYAQRPEPVVMSEPLVVWHESDKFLYVTPLPRPDQPGPRSLVAIDLKAVRAIQYLPKTVRVGGGDRILEVHDEPAPAR